MKQITFKLKTISPVAIGDGDQTGMSPYTDYVIDEGTVYYLDERELAWALQENPQAADKWVKNMQALMQNNRSNFDLWNFIDRDLDRHPLDIKRFEYEVQEMHRDKKQHIRTIQKSAGRLYIPGSTIKGAFRTALLWDWFLHDREGQEQLAQLARVIKFSKNAKPVQKEFDRIESLLFGNMKSDFRIDANRLHFRDSDFFASSPQPLCIVMAVRYHLVKRENDIPTPIEAIREERKSQFTLGIDDKHGDFRHPFLARFTEKQNWLELFRRYSTAFIKSEIPHLQRDKDLEDIRNFYEKQLKYLKKGGSLIRLGQGKNWQLNSIGLALESVDPNAIGALRKLFKVGKRGGEFPVTRVFSILEGWPYDPLGWVELN